MRSFGDSPRLFVDWLGSGLFEALFLNWRSRVKLTRVILGFLILMNFRTFEYFPGFRVLQDGWYGVTILAFLILYPLLKIVTDWTFTRFELYLLGILPILFVVPAITAHNVFGQPFFYGIFPQRSALPVLWWLLLINAWRLRWITETDLRATLVFVSWALCALFNSMRLFLNPANFEQVGFAVGTGSDASFTFPIYLNVFATFYYIFRGVREQRILFYILGLIQFASCLGHSGRSLSVAIVATLLVYVVRFRGVVRSLPIIASFIALLVLVIGLGLSVRYEDTAERLHKYSDAFRVVGGASEVQDVSANARIYETDTAKPYIAAHPILGVGAVSLQWEGGVVGAVGAYFVPGDIGFAGIMFTYGGFGLLVFLAQYLFVWSRVSGARGGSSSPLLQASTGFVLFSALYSAVTGLFVFSIETSSFFIAIITLLNSSMAQGSTLVRRQILHRTTSELRPHVGV